MAKSNLKKANDNFREKFIEDFSAWLKERGEEVQRTKNNEVAFPFVSELGTDEWLRITIAVPTGGRDGEQFDGYALAEELVIANAKKEENARKAAEAKAKKIAADAKRREIAAKKKEEEGD
jgi:hypothetical protein